MANKQNLKPQAHKLTVEEASKGGKKSAENRAARKTFKENLLAVLNEPLTVKDASGNSKPHPSGMTIQEAMIRGVIGRAVKGDPRAFEVLRDTIGEKPVQEVAVKTGDFSALDEAFKGMGKK